MIRRPLAILCENSRSADREFTPHRLLMACVRDDLPGMSSPWELAKAMPAIPKKGVPAVLRAITEDVEDLLSAFERLVVIVDDDHVRVHARLPLGDSCGAVASTLAARSGRPDDVEVFLLERNLETLVAAAARALAVPGSPLKGHAMRDKVLMRAATAPPTVRKAIRADLPSFDRIVLRVIAIVQAARP